PPWGDPVYVFGAGPSPRRRSWLRHDRRTAESRPLRETGLSGRWSIPARNRARSFQYGSIRAFSSLSAVAQSVQAEKEQCIQDGGLLLQW
ncbi:MAG: hypothetical protein AB2L13_15140, partial [Spirochaetota bacterium]